MVVAPISTSYPIYIHTLGHIKPLLHLAAKLVHKRPDIIITFTIAGDYQSKVKAEIGTYFDDEVLAQTIRLATHNLALTRDEQL